MLIFINILIIFADMRDDSKSVQETEQLWHNIFSQRLVLACLEEAQDGNLVTTSDGVPRVVGCNFTFVTKKGQPKIQVHIYLRNNIYYT